MPMNMPLNHLTLEQLKFDNRFVRELPADPRSDQYDSSYDPCTEYACALDAMADNHYAGVPINTGTYEGSYDLLSVSIGFRWGQGSGRYRDEESAAGDEPEPQEEPPPEPVVEEPEPIADEPPAEEPVEESAPVEPVPAEETTDETVEEPAGEEAP